MTTGLNIGPLRFATLLGDAAEPLGDGLEQVGATLTAAERRARSFDLTVPLRWDPATDPHADPRDAVRAQRQAVRAFFENRAWLSEPVPMTWDADPDLDLWLQIGGADMSDMGAGLSIGEWKLSLKDCYIVGRPSTHLPGRRVDIADCRWGTRPRDTFGTVYSDEIAGLHDSPGRCVVLPSPCRVAVFEGFVQSEAIDYQYVYREVNGMPDVRAGNPFRAADGQVVTYDVETDPWYSSGAWGAEHGRAFRMEAPRPGQVRLWDTGTFGLPATRTPLGDDFPGPAYGWRQVLGTLPSMTRPVSLENGICRVTLLGLGAVVTDRIGGWQYETWSASTRKFEPVGRFFTRAPMGVVVAELTNSRAVIEVVSDSTRSRIVLQAGWSGPRIEVLGPTHFRESYVQWTGDGTTPTLGTYGMWNLSADNRTRMAVATLDTSVAPSTFQRWWAFRTPRRQMVAQLGRGEVLGTAEPARTLAYDVRTPLVLVERV